MSVIKNSYSWVSLVVFSGIALAIVVLHTYHFENYNYRQDEAWMVQYALSTEESLPTLLIRNLYQPATEYFMIDVWVTLFGHYENITRFLGSLTTLLGLAFLYRFCTDLFDERVGLLAVFLLGTLAFVQFFSHEIRPYPALLAGTSAVHLTFFRWLKLPSIKRALPFVGAILFTVYVHPFIVYVVVAQAIFIALFVRWNTRLYMKAAALFIISGVLSLPRLFAMFDINASNHTGQGIGYGLKNEWLSLRILFEQMRIRPTEIGILLIGAAVILPIRSLFPHLKPDRTFWLSVSWRKWYLLFIPVAILILSFIVNQRVVHITPRNLIILLPTLAGFAALALKRLPWQGSAVILALICIPAINGYRPFVANGPYLQVAQYVNESYQGGDPVVIDGEFMWYHVPLTYYLQNRMLVTLTRDDIFHVMPRHQEWNLFSFPGGFKHLAMNATVQDLQAFQEFIGDAKRVWYVQVEGDRKLSDRFTQSLTDAGFVVTRQTEWVRADFYATHDVFLYERR